MPPLELIEKWPLALTSRARLIADICFLRPLKSMYFFFHSGICVSSRYLKKAISRDAGHNNANSLPCELHGGTYS